MPKLRSNMALIYQPTKLDPKVIEAAIEAVKEKKFKSKNDAYNSGLKTYFKIKKDKPKSK